MLAAASLAWVVVPTVEIHEHYGFERSEQLVQALSAHPADFVTRPATALMPVPARDDSLEGDSGGLFPGGMLLAVAVAGALFGIRDPARRRWAACLALMAVLAALLALGFNLVLMGWRPFATLRHVMPGLSELRAVFRFAALSQAVLPPLAALGLSEAARRLPRRAGRIVPAIVAVLGAVENLAIPQPLVPVPASPRSGWSAWLRAQPGQTVIAHIPLPDGLHVSHYELEAWRMFAQLDHGKRMINGYSSNFPPGYGRFQFDLNAQFPAYNVLCYLHDRLGVNVLVIDRTWLGGHAGRLEDGMIRALVAPAYEDTAVAIYTLEPPPGHCTAAP